MKIALLAPFSSFDDSYSPARVVAQSVWALKTAGHSVEVWCFETVRPDEPMLRGIGEAIRLCLKSRRLIPDTTSAERYTGFAAEIDAALAAFQPDAVITHDAMFTAAYVDVARAIHLLAKTSQRAAGAKWFHWAHSAVPPKEAQKEAVGCERWRRTLPDKHRLVYPNRSCAADAAAYYSLSPDRVLSIPNPHDASLFWGLSDAARFIADKYDLMDADAVQVYPFCATRWEGKGMPHLLRIFKSLKEKAIKARLVLATCNLNQVDQQTMIRQAIREHGLEDVVAVTAFIDAAYSTTTPYSLVQELFRLSNLFLFPTMGEACPLILVEAMAAGCVIGVNEQVPCLREYAPPDAIRFGLPRFHATTEYRATLRREDGERTVTGNEAYDILIECVAERTIAALDRCPSVRARRAARTFSLGRFVAAIEAAVRD